MLVALRISNFAVMEEVEVGFGPGLTVLTGETGAGKTILVDALGLLLGGRADAEVHPDRRGRGVGGGRLPAHARARRPARGAGAAGPRGRGGAPPGGGPHRAGQGVRQRRAGHGRRPGAADAGRGGHRRAARARQPVRALHRTAPAGPLRRRRPARWRRTGPRMRRWWRWTLERQSLGGDEPPTMRRAEFLRFQLDELERLAPAPGEEAALEAERRRLAAAERLRAAGARGRGAARCGGRRRVHGGGPRRQDAGGGREDGPRRSARPRTVGGLGRRRAGGGAVAEPPALPGRAGGGPGAARRGRGAAGRAPPAAPQARDRRGRAPRAATRRCGSNASGWRNRRERLLALDAERSAAEARAWEAARPSAGSGNARRAGSSVPWGASSGAWRWPRAAFEVQLAPARRAPRRRRRRGRVPLQRQPRRAGPAAGARWPRAARPPGCCSRSSAPWPAADRMRRLRRARRGGRRGERRRGGRGGTDDPGRSAAGPAGALHHPPPPGGGLRGRAPADREDVVAGPDLVRGACPRRGRARAPGSWRGCCPGSRSPARRSARPRRWSVQRGRRTHRRASRRSAPRRVA